MRGDVWNVIWRELNEHIFVFGVFYDNYYRFLRKIFDHLLKMPHDEFCNDSEYRIKQKIILESISFNKILDVLECLSYDQNISAKKAEIFEKHRAAYWLDLSKTLPISFLVRVGKKERRCG